MGYIERIEGGLRLGRKYVLRNKTVVGPLVFRPDNESYPWALEDRSITWTSRGTTISHQVGLGDLDIMHEYMPETLEECHSLIHLQRQEILDAEREVSEHQDEIMSLEEKISQLRKENNSLKKKKESVGWLITEKDIAKVYSALEKLRKFKIEDEDDLEKDK